MKNKNLLVAILVISVGVGGFFAGIKYQQSKQTLKTGFQTKKKGKQGILRNQQQTKTKAIKGEVISRDEKSITVKLPDNSSKLILISENTLINKTSEASVDDLKNGSQVMVFGKPNNDGSVSAVNIQVGRGVSFGRR